jgi:hypothetical protein
MSPKRLKIARLPSADIFGASYGLKMGGVYAGANAALVVDHKPDGDALIPKHERPSVSPHIFGTIPEISVSRFHNRAGP